METISDYTIYCTEEQTRKALELGAPIEFSDCTENVIKFWDGFTYAIPTAEQMRGWLMDKLKATTFANKHYSCGDKEGYGYLVVGKDCVIERTPVLNGRWLLCSDREAILAAIDATLDYLIKKNS